jgi:hypothetical protein
MIAFCPLLFRVAVDFEIDNVTTCHLFCHFVKVTRPGRGMNAGFEPVFRDLTASQFLPQSTFDLRPWLKSDPTNPETRKCFLFPLCWIAMCMKKRQNSFSASGDTIHCDILSADNSFPYNVPGCA